MVERGKGAHNGEGVAEGMITAGYRRSIRLDGEKDVVEIELRVNIPASASEAEVDAAVRSAQRAIDAMRASVDNQIREVTQPELPAGWPLLETTRPMQAAPATASGPMLPAREPQMPAAAQERIKGISTQEPEREPDGLAIQQPGITGAVDELAGEAGSEPAAVPGNNAKPSAEEGQVSGSPAAAASEPHQPEPATATRGVAGRAHADLAAPPVASLNEQRTEYESPAEEARPVRRIASPSRPAAPTSSRWTFGSRAEEPAVEQEQATSPAAGKAPAPAAELQEAVSNVVNIPKRTAAPAANRAAAAANNPRTELPATPQQLQSIRDMGNNDLRLSENQLDQKIREMTGRPLSTISRNQAYDVIIKLRQEVNRREGGEELTELERARAVVAPIGPFKGKTLGEIEAEKPGAVNYFITARGVEHDIQEAARIIVNNRKGGETDHS